MITVSALKSGKTEPGLQSALFKKYTTLYEGSHMRYFIIVGMPASGKNIARTYAQQNGISYFATGDIVREEQKKRNIDPTPDNMAALSGELRGNDGLGVTRLALKAATKASSGVAFLEGMRSWPEIELIRDEVKACVVAFVAPRDTRRARIVSRGRPDDSPEGFDLRDTREIEYGAADPIAMADEYILNTGTEDDALKGLGRIMEKYGHR